MPRARRPERLELVEVTCAHDCLAFALAGEEGVRYRMGPMVECDWKEAPILVTAVAHMIARELRPGIIPPIPAVAFGDDPMPAIHTLLGSLDIGDAVRRDMRLVSADQGSDAFFFALCPKDLDLASLDQRYESDVLRIQQAMEREEGANNG